MSTKKLRIISKYYEDKDCFVQKHLPKKSLYMTPRYSTFLLRDFEIATKYVAKLYLYHNKLAMEAIVCTV